ncbi:MAG: NAD(P)H-quinone oxidoreductase [Betaproteobacteria bacterium]|jgi:putative PIG3 family NAD(P)H quinone oxidoreductase|nr:NAD(P)H-quinone oxidoreductase [Betaproteobacteria bacterium]
MSELMKFVSHGEGGAPDVMHLSETNVPKPAAGEVLVKVAYAGVNRPDCLQRSGRYPPPPGASPILGLEASGQVVALGEGVTRWKQGDLVCGLANGGAYAEYVCIPQGQALPVPAGLTLLQAAALPENYFTVWTNVFQRGKLQAGETFLVHGGSSGIGLTAIQLAKAFGARVMCTVGNTEKMHACQAAGADLSINYRTQDFVKEVMSATDQKGVNIILDMVGGDYMQRNINCLAVDGRLVQIAFLQPSKTEVDWIGLMVKRLTFTGSTLRPRTAVDKAQMAKELHEQVWPLLQQGKCLPVVHQVFDLSEAKQAHELMESSTHIGKIMLKVAGG